MGGAIGGYITRGSGNGLGLVMICEFYGAGRGLMALQQLWQCLHVFAIWQGRNLVHAPQALLLSFTELRGFNYGQH